jgi:O-antigen ligase
MVLFQDTIVDSLAQWAGETPNESAAIVIAGQEVDYTGTSHRIILFQAYETPLARLGPLGYGSPLPDDKMDEIPARFRSIDNHYVLFLLQRGPLGLGLFVLLAIATLFNLAMMALDEGQPTADLAAGLFGAMALVTLLLVSVWFAPDFGMMWLFVAGLTSNLRSLRNSSARDNSTTEKVAVGPIPRLGPGHAPIR